MQRIKNIAKKILSTSSKSKDEGIFATLEDLVEQRQYLKFIKYHSKRKSYSRNAGDVKSAFKGRGMEFEEIRAYQYGDEVRDIDWRVTARKSTPYTKIYNEEKDREIYVFLDLSSSMVFGTKKELKSVSAAKVASLLGWLSLENKDKFGCLIYDGQDSLFFKPSNSQNNFLVILNNIALATKKVAFDKVENTNGFEKNLQLLQRSIKSRAEIFIISDFYNFDEKVIKSLNMISKKGKVFIVDVFDKIEKTAPEEGEYMISIDNNNNIVFDTWQEGLKSSYIEYFAQKDKSIRDFCLKSSIEYMSVSTDIPIFEQIKIG